MSARQRKRPADRPGAGYTETFDALHQRSPKSIRPQPAAQLLSCLDGVRETGSGRWLARCPAHDDKRPSLSIRELDDGRLLVHCFGGCDTSAVLAAVGLSMVDLYHPDRPESYGPPERRPWRAQDVLAALATESTVAAVAASALAQGEQLSEADHQRLLQAAGRLSEGARLARGVLR